MICSATCLWLFCGGVTAPVCRHSKSDVSGHSTEWDTALAVGGAEKDLLFFLCKTEFKAFALAVAVWGQYCLTADGCAGSQRDWKNGKTGRNLKKNLMREHRL